MRWCAIRGRQDQLHGLDRYRQADCPPCHCTLKRVSFELGGKSPNVIFADADTAAATAGACAAVFPARARAASGARASTSMSSSSTTSSADRRLCQIAAQGPGPRPRNSDRPAGFPRAVRPRLGVHRDRSRGGRRGPYRGGCRGDIGYFVEPTVMVKATGDMRVAREKIFGPVVTAIPSHERGGSARARATTLASASAPPCGPRM